MGQGTTTASAVGRRSRRSTGWAQAVDRVVTSVAARAIGGACADLMDLLLPSLCAVCTRPPGTLCRDCEIRLRAALLHPYRAEEGAAALPLLGQDLLPLPVVATAPYRNEVAAALLAFKDHGRTGLSVVLRPALHRAMVAAEQLVPGVIGGDPHGRWPRVLLVPMPGRAAGFRRRGYDPLAELLAGPLPHGWELRPGLLAPRRSPPQGIVALLRSGGTGRASHSGATVSGRRRQGQGRFRPTRAAIQLSSGSRAAPVPPIVLVDDVMTTGSTLAAAVQALASTGLVPVGAVVLAAVSPPADQDERQSDRT